MEVSGSQELRKSKNFKNQVSSQEQEVKEENMTNIQILDLNKKKEMQSQKELTIKPVPINLNYDPFTAKTARRKKTKEPVLSLPSSSE